MTTETTASVPVVASAHVPVAAPIMMADGFANMIAMIGGANSKSGGNAYLVKPESDGLIDAAYRVSPFFRKIVDIRPRDAVRRWRQWQSDNDDIELIEAEEGRLDAIGCTLKALTMQRKYGGAVIIGLGLPGDADQEVKPDAIGKGSLQRLVVLSRYDVNLQDFDTDPLSEFYGYPSKVVINSGSGETVTVHPSRCVFFRPTNTTVRPSSEDMFWGDSLWQTLEDAVGSVDSSSAVISDLMREAKVDVIRVPDLFEKMATDAGTETFVRRFTLVNMLKSISNAMLLDKNDEWDQKTITWTGIPEVVMLQMQLLCGASGYTMTRLYGIQAKGLSNDGTADLKQYYDDVDQERELDITPSIRRMDDWIIRSATGKRDPSTWYIWRSLWQLSDKERADIDKLQAETVSIYVNTGLFDPRALAQSVQARMIESGSWPALEQAISEISSEPNPEDDLPDDEEEQPAVGA